MLVKFLEMRAIAAELSICETTRHVGSSKMMARFLTKGGLNKKGVSYSEASTTKTTSTTHGGISCPVCKVNKHPLYSCPSFKALPIDRRVVMARESDVCFNCLNTGHLQAQCLSIQRCQKCQRPHHTLLHCTNESTSRTGASQGDIAHTSKLVLTRASQLSCSQQVLLMTCQGLAVGHDGSTYQARALLDLASSASFVSERLTQHLRLSHHNHGPKIMSIGREMMRLSSRGSVGFHIKSTHANGRALELEALVQSKITSDVPSYNVAFNSK